MHLNTVQSERSTFDRHAFSPAAKCVYVLFSDLNNNAVAETYEAYHFMPGLLGQSIKCFDLNIEIIVAFFPRYLA